MRREINLEDVGLLKGMSSGVGIFRRGVIFLLLLTFLLPVYPLRAEDARPVRLIALIDRDDQGDLIEFPIYVYYDYWASETYLISSTGRITVYDQRYFPIASFGRGRGVENPRGLAVDRRGNIYMCMDSMTQGKQHSALVVYNQAFFRTMEITFEAIPELTDFIADRVAVAESGDIYLVGHFSAELFAGVAVFGPTGKFLRILRPPENNAVRLKPKSASSEPRNKPEVVVPISRGENQETIPEGLPVELKPKASRAVREGSADEEGLSPDYISDVKIDRQGRIYLLSRETSHIYVLNSKEEYLFKFGEKGGADRKLSNPISVAIDLERRVIYVCDYMRHTILCYDYDSGRYVFEFGGKGVSPLWFNYPNCIDVDQRGRVIIADLFNRRLQVLDPNMGERRVLPGRISEEPASAVLPTPEAPLVAAESPEVAVKPTPVEPLPLPSPLVVSSLPAPLPSKELPVSALPPLPLPVATASPREIAPRQVKLLKRIPALAPPVPDMIRISTPLKAQASIPMPGPVRTRKKAGGRGSGTGSLIDSGYLLEALQRFETMPAAVGVYGPVAGLLGLGSRLLIRNR